MQGRINVKFDTERQARDLRAEILLSAVFVTPRSQVRRNCWGDDFYRSITFAELYGVLSSGPPGEYVLEDA